MFNMEAVTVVVVAAASTVVVAAVRSAAATARGFVAEALVAAVFVADQASGVDQADSAEGRTAAFAADASEARADVSDRLVSDRGAVTPAPGTPAGVTAPAPAGVTPRQQLNTQ